MGHIVCGQLKDSGKSVEKDKELNMKNQTVGKRGGPRKGRPMKDPGSKTVGGKGPAANTSKGKSTVASTAVGLSSGSADSPIVPDGAKGGHD